MLHAKNALRGLVQAVGRNRWFEIVEPAGDLTRGSDPIGTDTNIASVASGATAVVATATVSSTRPGKLCKCDPDCVTGKAVFDNKKICDVKVVVDVWSVVEVEEVKVVIVVELVKLVELVKVEFVLVV